MTRKNEVTGAKVRRIASRILSATEITVWTKGATERNRRAVSPADIRALAASCLTQSPTRHPDEWGDTEPIRKPKRNSKRKKAKR